MTPDQERSYPNLSDDLKPHGGNGLRCFLIFSEDLRSHSGNGLRFVFDPC